MVFLAAVSALFLMTILSGLLGWVATQFIPRSYTLLDNLSDDASANVTKFSIISLYLTKLYVT